MKTKSQFLEWFEKQHGKRPAAGNVDDVTLRQMILTGEGAGRELYLRQLYDARKQSALYAWQVKR